MDWFKTSLLAAALGVLMTAPAYSQKTPPADNPPSDVQAEDGAVDEEPWTSAAPPPVPASTTDAGPLSPELTARIESAMAGLGEGFEPGEAAAFAEMMASTDEPDGEAFFGQTLFMRRQFDRAAWFFGADVLANPDRVASLNNFASVLEEVYLDAPDPSRTEWLTLSVDLLRRAHTFEPENASVLNNLGRALLSQWRADPNTVDPHEALGLLERANGLRPDDMVVLGNLARAFEAVGDTFHARETLTRMHQLRASHPSLSVARERASEETQQSFAERERDYCNVDFRCQQVCPPTLIGGVNVVSCELDQDTARQQCSRGEPYPTSYDCVGEIPEFGIQIPGIHSGFSISTPFGSVQANTDGEGNVRWRVEAGPNFGPVNPYLRADGRYNPDGGWSATEWRGGVKYNLVHNNPVGAEAGRWGYQPAYIQGESTGGAPTNFSAGVYGNGTILH